jgi:hypothetical protein
MKYKCENCDHLADRDTFFDLSYRRPRFEVGDLFTDKECPECGGCAFPTDDPVVNLRYAAPELLAALQEIAEMDGDGNWSTSEFHALCSIAKAAIAKATATSTEDERPA